MRIPALVLTLSLAAIALPNASIADTAAATVNSRLQNLVWLTGTFSCTFRSTFQKHQPKTGTFNLVGTKPRNGWIELSSPDLPGNTYYSFDPKKNKYVIVNLGDSGSYGLAYATLQNRTLVVSFPSAATSGPETPQDSAQVRPSANGFQAIVKGVSTDYPGERSEVTEECTRKS